MKTVNARWTVVACLLVAAALSGCKKETSSSAGGGGAPSTPGAAAATNPASAGGAVREDPVTVDDVVGQWQSVKVEMAPMKDAEMAKGIEKMLLGMKTEIRPDHTYNAFSDAMGRSNGTWALDGDKLTLTPAAVHSIMKPITLVVARPRLISRQGDTLAVIYEKQGPASVDTGPKHKLTVEEFFAEIKKDEAAAKQKYDGATVELTGMVTGIDVRASGPYVFVSGPPKEGADLSMLFGGLMCSPAEPEVWAKVARHQRVKVVGVATVGYGSGQLSEAKFTPEGPSVLVPVTAEALAAEYAKDPRAAEAKYKTGGVLITGTVLDKKIGRGEASVLQLGKEDARVICTYSNDGSDVEKALAPVAVGQTITLAGEARGSFRDDEKSPKLHNCLLVTRPRP